MRQCGAKNLRIAKVRQSLERAYATGGHNGNGHSNGHFRPLDLPTVRPYDEALLTDTVASLTGEVDHSYFIARSPLTTWNRTPAGFLHQIFRPGEKAWVTSEDKSPNGCLWTHQGAAGCRAEWVHVKDYPGELVPSGFDPNFSCLSFFERFQQHVWFLSNPIDGQAYQRARFPAGYSYRCIEAVTAWRYLVLETDCAPAPLWLALLALLPLPIVAIYQSGKRGAHALVQIDASSKSEADNLVETFRREYVPLGACKDSLSAFRLTRLPNCFRSETGRLQQLLYLNAHPTGQPIKDLPIRRKVL
jgi:hypothetical protein